MFFCQDFPIRFDILIPAMTFLNIKGITVLNFIQDNEILETITHYINTQLVY